MGKLKYLMGIFVVFFILGKTSAEEFYVRKQVTDARFGDDEKARFTELAHQISETMGSQIFGQSRAIQALEAKAIQYIESFPDRKGEPVAMNLIGLPGIGKTALIEGLKNMGLPVLMLNAQNFTDPGLGFTQEAYNALNNIEVTGQNAEGETAVVKPVVLVIDEFDKVPEISSKNGEEMTYPIVGAINSILSEGYARTSYQKINFSNAFIITTMNFSPVDMQNFSGEAFGKPKNFFDFTTEDFKKFDEWIRNKTSSRYKILSNLFRTNTVSRLAPNTVVMSPLGEEEYAKIAQFKVEQAIERIIRPAEIDDQLIDKRISVSYDRSLIDFLIANTVFPPSGARETVHRTNGFVEQLINFGIKSESPTGTATIDRPRHIHIGLKDDKAVITIKSKKWVKGKLVDDQQFDVTSVFDRSSKQFLVPENLVVEKPSYSPGGRGRRESTTLTKRQIREARFPKVVKFDPEIERSINEVLIGQHDAVKTLLSDLQIYLGRQGPALAEPSSRVFSGFPGIGKSELVKLVAQKLDLPVVKINMQQYSSDSASTVKDFILNLRRRTLDFRVNNQKYILQIEELDKTFEINPQNGAVVNRPVMAVIKDILNDGQVSINVNDIVYEIDLRSAFIAGTMNFAIDKFGFTADPRLTTADHVYKAWEKLLASPMVIKEVLGSMFLPETVSRLMSKFMIMKPLVEKEYKTLISKQVNSIIESRLFDSDGTNVGLIEIELSPQYKKYLFSETVIPSEGARYTVLSVRQKISGDLETALANIPKSSDMATAPLLLTLDYSPAKESVVVKAQRSDQESSRPEIVATKPVALQFPSVALRGKVPIERLRVSAHELGHALMGARLGMRFSQVVVVSPKPGIGGYVSFIHGDDYTAHFLVSQVFAMLASRAIERIVLSENPRLPESVLDITPGPSQDIKMATQVLYSLIYAFGLDPNGGTIDRNFSLGGGAYANFESIPNNVALQLGDILREMEDFMVQEFLEEFSVEWLVEKSTKLARAGAMNEKQFYSLVGLDHNDTKRESMAYDYFIEIFGSNVRRKSNDFKGPLEDDPRRETVDKFFNKFKEVLNLGLHGDIEPADSLSPQGKSCSIYIPGK